MCLKDFSCDLTQFFCFRGRKKSTATASTPAAVKKRSPSPPKLSPQKKTPSPAKTPGKRGRPLGSGSKKTTTRYNNENIRSFFHHVLGLIFLGPRRLHKVFCLLALGLETVPKCWGIGQNTYGPLLSDITCLQWSNCNGLYFLTAFL